MTKAQSYYHEGFEFIRISTLPIFQVSEFSEWIPKSSIFTMEVENEKFTDCVSYSEYEFWHDLKAQESPLGHYISF